MQNPILEIESIVSLTKTNENSQNLGLNYTQVHRFLCFTAKPTCFVIFRSFFILVKAIRPSAKIHGDLNARNTF